MPEWDPEIEVDADRAHALIGAQFPELANAEVREVAAGWDNIVHWSTDDGPSVSRAARSLCRESAAKSRFSPGLRRTCRCLYAADVGLEGLRAWSLRSLERVVA